MKWIIVVALAFAAVAVAAPVEPQQGPKIVKQEYKPNPDGSYTSVLETDDGTRIVSEGELKQVPGEDNKPRIILVIRGSFTFINPDGKTETINYNADENGYNAEGESIPKQPAARR